MKQNVVGLLLFLAAGTARAQGFTQTLQAGLAQLAALQAYGAVVEKGYAALENGLDVIGRIKNGEFGLHTAFFGSLEMVSPAVRDMSEVSEIIEVESATISRFSAKLASYRSGEGLGAGELFYINQVYDGLVKAGQEVVMTLARLLTDGALGMSDGERIGAIQSLDLRVRSEERVVAAFTDQTDLLVAQRSRAGGDIGAIRELYGIPK